MDSESRTCLPANKLVIGVDAKDDKPILCVLVNLFEHVSIHTNTNCRAGAQGRREREVKEERRRKRVSKQGA